MPSNPPIHRSRIVDIDLDDPADLERLAAMVGAEHREPVCPRCLDVEPGVPGGDPSVPHPGTFTPDLCTECSDAVELEARRERGQ